MIHTYADPSGVLRHILHTVRRGPPQFRNQKIVNPNLYRLPLRPPHPTAVFEVTHQFLFLRIYRNHWLALGGHPNRHLKTGQWE